MYNEKIVHSYFYEEKCQLVVLKKIRAIGNKFIMVRLNRMMFSNYECVIL